MHSPMLQHGWALRYGKTTYYMVILVQNVYYKLIHRGQKARVGVVGWEEKWGVTANTHDVSEVMMRMF